MIKKKRKTGRVSGYGQRKSYAEKFRMLMSFTSYRRSGQPLYRKSLYARFDTEAIFDVEDILSQRHGRPVVASCPGQGSVHDH